MITRFIARLFYRDHRWLAEIINKNECLRLDWRPRY